MVNLGWIDYLNLLPLKAELQAELGGQFASYYGHPAEVNERIRKGLVDVAPASSVCLTEPAFFEMKLPLGVCSHGPVESVILTARDQRVYEQLVQVHDQACSVLVAKPISEWHEILGESKATRFGSHDIPLLTVYFTLASETSRALAKVIWRLWFGRDPIRVDDPKSADVVLRIGDSALWAHLSGGLHFDLGALWQDLTGLPFVFAVWQGAPGRALPAGFSQMVLDAAFRAEDQMVHNPEVYFDFLPVLDQRQKRAVAAYWQKIQYSLHPPHMRALRVFLNLIAGADGQSVYPIRAPLRSSPSMI